MSNERLALGDTATYTARVPVGLRTALLALTASTGACAHWEIPATLIERVRAGEIDPCRVLFVCHGMLYDLGAPWDTRLQTELCERGQLGLVASYWSDPLGVWFNWGCVPPGRLIAEAADRIALLHAESGCQRELRLYAVGFSNGCEAILEAGKRVGRGRFERVVFINSSSLAVSAEAGALVSAGVIGSLINYWSLLDVVTILAPFGAGQFALHFGGDGVQNRLTWMFHLGYLIDMGYRERIMDDLLGPCPAPAVGPSEFGHRLADLLDELDGSTP